MKIIQLFKITLLALFLVVAAIKTTEIPSGIP